MFILGLLILAAVVVGAVEIVLANRSEVTLTLWNQSWQLERFWVAVVGAGLLLAAVIGLALMRASAARHRRIRRENRALAAENRRLAERAELDRDTATPMDMADEPMPAEEPGRRGMRGGMRGRRAVAREEVRGDYPGDAGYPRGAAYPDGAVADGRPVADAGASPADAEGMPADGEHHGFFGRHTMSGRRTS